MANDKVEEELLDSSNQYLCIATNFPVGKWRHVIPFLRMSSQVQKQLKETPGLVRFGLLKNLPHLPVTHLSNI